MCLMSDALVSLLNEWTYEQVVLKQGGFIHFNSSGAAHAGGGGDFVCRNHSHDGHGSVSVAVRVLDPHGFTGPLAEEYKTADIRHIEGPMFFGAYAGFLAALARPPASGSLTYKGNGRTDPALLCDPARKKRDSDGRCL